MTEKKRKGAAGVRGGTSRELAHCIDVSSAAVALRCFCLVFFFSSFSFCCLKYASDLMPIKRLILETEPSEEKRGGARVK